MVVHTEGAWLSKTLIIAFLKKNCSSNSINLCAHRLNSSSYKKDQLHGRKGEMYIKVVLTRIC